MAKGPSLLICELRGVQLTRMSNEVSIPLKNKIAAAYARLEKEAFRRFGFRRLLKRNPCKIVIGASGIFQEGWISTDQELLDLLRPMKWKRYFRDQRIDAILAEHIWEHLRWEEGILAAGICFQYLKPGGYLRAAVPDGLHPDAEYIEWVRPGGIGAGAQDHKMLYTYKTFSKMFELAGFRVDLLEYFDENGQFHFKDWSPADGLIQRSSRFDERNAGAKLKYTSIILDARK